MKIQTKLSLLFSLIFGIVLLLFIGCVYFFYNNNCKTEYFAHLRLKASLKFDLIDGETVDSDVLRIIYENTPGDYEPYITIYNYQGQIIYQDRGDSTFLQEEEESRINQVRIQGTCQWWDDDYQTIGFTLDSNGDKYIIMATGCDVLRIARIRYLLLILGCAYLAAMLLIIIVGRFFARQAFLPVSRMVEQVKEITSSNLDIRVDEGNKKDELARLAVTFNKMLSQIENAFNAQKQFVYNISHELRTPLSAIVTSLELAENRSHTAEEYKEIVHDTTQDAYRLVRLSNSLLDMAKANYDPSAISMRTIRIDELLLDVCMEQQKQNQEYTIPIHFEEDPDDDRLISVSGNEYLLRVAFINLIDNACKYSADKTCEVVISYEKNRIVLHFTDHGTGIPENEQQDIFIPFFRGSNKSVAEGNGIGLPLVRRIVEIHGGILTLVSRPGFTSFSIKLKHL